MTDSREFYGDEWKESLRYELIKAFFVNEENREAIYSKIGEYYMCCAPAYLYKYYRDDISKLNTIKSNKMWYSAPIEFNDVFDCDISIDKKEIFNSSLSLVKDKRTVREGSPMWRQLNKTISEAVKNLQQSFENMKSSMGIACLSEEYDSLLMWAHYANNHRGICVEYDLLEINKQLTFSPVPMIYSERKNYLTSIDQISTDEDTTKVFVESITTKSPEWSYEKEWRIIRDDVACGSAWSSEKRGALLNMISPKSIILGCMTKSEFAEEVRKYCEDCKINLYKMEKDNSLYRLNKVPILQFNE